MDEFYLTRIKEIIGECENILQDSGESSYAKEQAIIRAYLDIREVFRITVI